MPLDAGKTHANTVGTRRGGQVGQRVEKRTVRVACKMSACLEEIGARVVEPSRW